MITRKQASNSHRALGFMNMVAPKSLLRLVKSLLFWRKHNSTPFFNRSFHFPPEIENLTSLTLIFGHSSFTSNLGGTERIILEQTEVLLSQNQDSIFIYPKGKADFLNFLKPSFYGVILNGFEICELTKMEMVSFFKGIQPKINEVRIHHLLFWPLAEVASFIQSFKVHKIKVTLFVHDFYYTCPKVNFFCKSGQHQCQSSYYSSTIQSWRRAFENIMDMADAIVTPSDYMKRQVPARFSSKTMTFDPLHGANKRQKLKLAYLGAASAIKGYTTWAHLSKNALITRRYELLHIGSALSTDLEVPSFPYSYAASPSDGAPELLEKLEVDLVLLWSQVPESYSFTFQEAKQAKKYVITSLRSGNIAENVLAEKSLGVALDSDYSLIQFLLKEK